MAIAGALEVQLLADVARIRDDMQKATGFVTSGARSMERAAAGVKAALGGIVAGLSVAALSNWIRGAIDAAEGMSKLSQTIGVATHDIGGLQLAYKMAGLESNAMQTSIARLSKSLIEPNKGIAALGIRTKEAGGSFRSTKAVLYDVADQIAKMPDGLQKTAIAVEIFGRAGAEMIPLLNGGSQGMREMDEMARKLGLTIDEETGRKAEQFNDTLDLIGQGSQGVAREIMAQLLPSLQSLAGSFLTSMTEGDKLKNTANFLAAGLKILYSVAVGVVEVFSTVGKVLGGVAGIIVAALRGDFSEAKNIFLAMKSDIGASWADTAKMIKAAWSEEGDAAIAAAVKANKAGTDLLAQAKAREAAGNAAAAAAKKEAEAFAALMAKLNAKESGTDADFLKNLQLLAEQGKKAGLSLAEITRLQELYIAQQPYMVEQAKARTKAEEDAKKAVDALYASRNKLFEQAGANEKKAADMLTQLQFEAKLIGLTNEERTVAIALRQLEATGIDQTTEAYQKLRAEVEQQVRDNVQAEGGIEAAKKVQQEWEATNKQIADSFVDNLMRGGKSVAQYLKDLFRTLILRPLLQPVGQFMSGMVGMGMNAMGIPTGAPGSNALSMAGNAASVYTGLSSWGSNIATSAGIGGTLFGTGGGASAYAMSAGALEAGVMTAGVGGTAGLMGSVTAALSAIPVWGWAAMAALAIFGLSKKGGGPKLDGVYGAIGSDLGKSDNSLLSTVKPVVDGLQTQYEGLNKLFGGAGGITFGLGVSTDPKGTSPTFLDIGASRDGKQLFSNLNRTVGRSEQDLKQALAVGGTDAIIGALKASDLDQPFADFFAKVAADASQEAKESAIKVASDVASYSQPLSDLGGVFAQLATLSVEARNGMIEAAGGLQALAQSTTTYYENFYSEEERRAITIGRIGTAFASVGLSLDGIDLSAVTARTQFRAIVDSLDLTTEAGQKQYTVLMGLSGAFASVTPAADALTESVAEAVAPLETLADAIERLRNPLRTVEDIARGIISLEDERDSLQVQLRRASGDEAGARQWQRAIDTAGMDEAEIAIYDYNQGLRDQIQALRDAAIETEKAAAKAKQVAAERAGLEARFMQLVGDTAGLRQREIEALNDSNRPLQWTIWALEDEAAARDNLLAAYEREKSELQQTIDKHKSYARSLREARDAMFLDEDSPLNPAARTAEALRQYQDTFAAAQGGDLEAIARLQGAGTAYLKALKDSSPTKLDYTRGFASVVTGLTITASASEAAASVAQSQLDVMTAQLTALGLLKDVTHQGFDAMLAAYGAAKANVATAIGAQSAPAQVSALESLYQDLFGRQSDVGGLAFWNNAMLNGGMSLAEVEAAFKASPEGKLKGYASGGWHPGGLRFVGEGGVELEATGPARYYSNEQTRRMLGGSGDNSALLEELKAQRAENRAIVRALMELRRIVQRWDGNGIPEERAVAA